MILSFYSTAPSLQGFFRVGGLGVDEGICVHNGKPLPQTTPLFIDISVSTSVTQFRSDISTNLDSSNLTVFDSVCLFHVSSDKNSYFEAFLVMVGASCQFVVSRLGQSLLSKSTNIDNIFFVSYRTSYPYSIFFPTWTQTYGLLKHPFRVPSLMVRPKVGLVLSQIGPNTFVQLN